MIINELAFIDPAAEMKLRRQLGRESYQAGRADGYAQGVTAMAEAYKRGLKNSYASARREADRWTVLCGSCRRNGRRDDCTRCEVRNRETFGLPHPDDYVPATRPRLEAAS